MPQPPPTPSVAATSLSHLESALLARLRANKIRIPPYPAVATKLQRLAQGGKCGIEDLANVVKADPTLTAAILGRASTAVQGAGSVHTLREAISRIGIDQLIQLALASGLGEVAVTPGPLSVLRRDVWRCALLGARLSSDLAAKRNTNPEVAYLAGLLHDFGAVVVIGGLEEIAKEVPLPSLPEALWRQFIAKLSVQFGMVVGARWHLPAEIVDVIAHHRDPGLAASPLVALVKIVDRVIAILDRTPGTGVAALLEVTELSTDERYKIGAALPEVVAQMDSYTATAAVIAGPSSVEAAKPTEEAWRIDFDVVQLRHAPYRATSISPNSFTFTGPEPMMPNWLVEVTLHIDPEPMAILINVKSCEQQGSVYTITAAPFALGGPLKQRWLNLLERARIVLDVA